MVLAMLRGYVSRTRQVEIRLSQFADFVKQYAESYQHKHATLRMFIENTPTMLAPVLMELAETGKCTLEFDGNEIKRIVFDQYLADRVRAAYTEIEREPDLPFPSEEGLQIAAPPSIQTVNIKTEFVKWLSAKPKGIEVLRLSFPEEISNMPP